MVEIVKNICIDRTKKVCVVYYGYEIGTGKVCMCVCCKFMWVNCRHSAIKCFSALNAFLCFC